MTQQDPNRRQFHQWTLAALGGAVAGTVIGCGDAPKADPDKTDETEKTDAMDTTDETNADASAEATEGEGEAVAVDEKLLLADKHICRGLNTCKGKGADGKNECAGQGICATVEHHGCGGDHACKGQSGCGETAGVNACKNMGDCAVPAHAGAWEVARERFEKLLTAENKTFGPAPAAMEE